MRDQLHPRDNRPKNGTYRDRVAASQIDRDVARARFAASVDRALRIAHANGLTDLEIYEISKVSTSTFHRWRTQQFKNLPTLDKVRAFFSACGADVEDALTAYGISEKAAPAPTSEPPLPEDVRIILRRLADPNVDEREKDFIRQSLSMLADRAGTTARRDDRPAG
jgi:hypothetical protein